MLKYYRGVCKETNKQKQHRIKMHINYRKQNQKSKRVQNIEMHKFQTNQNAN